MLLLFDARNAQHTSSLPERTITILLIWCRYNHLSTLLTKILVEKSDDALNKLEDESKDFKREKFTYKEPFIKDNPGRTPSEVLAHAQWQMMKVTLRSFEEKEFKLLKFTNAKHPILWNWTNSYKWNTYIFQTACGDPKFIPNESFGE